MAFNRNSGNQMTTFIRCALILVGLSVYLDNQIKCDPELSFNGGLDELDEQFTPRAPMKFKLPQAPYPKRMVKDKKKKIKKEEISPLNFPKKSKIIIDAIIEKPKMGPKSKTKKPKFESLSMDKKNKLNLGKMPKDIESSPGFMPKKSKLKLGKMPKETEFSPRSMPKKAKLGRSRIAKKDKENFDAMPKKTNIDLGSILSDTLDQGERTLNEPIKVLDKKLLSKKGTESTTTTEGEDVLLKVQSPDEDHHGAQKLEASTTTSTPSGPINGLLSAINSGLGANDHDDHVELTTVEDNYMPKGKGCLGVVNGDSKGCSREAVEEAVTEDSEENPKHKTLVLTQKQKQALEAMGLDAETIMHLSADRKQKVKKMLTKKGFQLKTLGLLFLFEEHDSADDEIN